ncbi:LysR family transcriptional regulator [Castellaniella sp. GW247-6E4]|uniref:LysR family transcriptional regulator n=1 Tax=Castellaniella sp. GW247-6E4 TaxID=3140380 RepID=UPI003314E050
MEIRQLEALMAIVTSGSVTAAGRLLGRSQPVVSRQISDLEHELGFILFTRTRPTITLTPQGEDFYQEVRSVLADLQQLEARAQDIAAGQTRPLRILVTADLAHGILPDVLARVDGAHPVFQQKLLIEEVLHESVGSALIEGRADIGLSNLPIDYEQCRTHWCGQAPCMLALPMNHPLAEQSVIRLESLGNTDVITLLGRYRMRYHLTNALVRATEGYPRRHIEASSQFAVVSMVRAGLGVALIDPFTAQGARLDGVAVRPIDVQIPYMVGVVSHQNRRLPDEALRLIEGLRTYMLSSVPHFVETGIDGLPSHATCGSRGT